ncbi:hypothetical protein N6H14_29895 [Paenibacillus sp. CC-CFT747]|nr:hypothetical protein N6H14_29895 [Paenibacillus sp. CC-CFT747]
MLETNRPMTERKASSLLDEVLRLSRLVHDVLDLSKLEAERTDLKKSEESLASLAGQLIEKTRYLADDKAISVTLEEPAAEVRVQVDKARLMQALYNLLANAIHYTEGEEASG